MKFIKKTLFTLILTFACLMGVNAATGSITASTSTRTAVVGSTFTVTVRVSCNEAIGSWQFGVSYDSSNISLVSGDTSIAGFGDGSMKSKTYTYKFKAIKAGSASIRISSPSMVSWNDDGTLFTPSSSGATVTIKTQAQIEASYSKDNTLKALSVEGYELSPAFDKNTTEYTVSVPDTVTEIKVAASKSDPAARVSGTGTIDLSEGKNKVEIVVTAENGSIKTYTITIDVRDLNPIEVKVDGKTYTIVKKKELLTSPVGYSEKVLTIDDIEVPAYTSELTKLTVVGLKDETGNIAMYTYDEDSKTYELYKDIKGTSITLFPIKNEGTLKGFTKTTLEIDGVEQEVFKSNTIEDLYVIYAMNVETGVKSYYIYDADNKSFIHYNSDAFADMINTTNEYKLYLIAIGGVASILLLMTIILGTKNSKLKSFIRSVAEASEKEKEASKPKKEEQIEQPNTENTGHKKKKKHKHKNNNQNQENSL